MEINLLEKFPKIHRDLTHRLEGKTDLEKAIARQFGAEFFDGDRKYGYGGYNYHPRFWGGVVEDLQAHYRLTPHSRVLDIGCAKGFLLYDLQRMIPGITIAGLDISFYAINHAPESVKAHLKVGDARSLPYEDHSFDLVISLNTLHNFDGEDLLLSLREIQRVSAKNSYITVDAYRTVEEQRALQDWVLTARSVLHVDEWKAIFHEAGYTGDYHWFML